MAIRPAVDRFLNKSLVRMLVCCEHFPPNDCSAVEHEMTPLLNALKKIGVVLKHGKSKFLSYQGRCCNCYAQFLICCDLIDRNQGSSLKGQCV